MCSMCSRHRLRYFSVYLQVLLLSKFPKPLSSATLKVVREAICSALSALSTSQRVSAKIQQGYFPC